MSASRAFRRYRGWIAAAVLLGVAGSAYYIYQGQQSEEPTVTYQTEDAYLGTVSVTVSGTGNLVVDNLTEVWPAITGTVARVSVAEGDSVATGTVLFTLDAASVEAETARTYSSYRQAQQNVAQATSNLSKAENSLADLESRYAEQQLTGSTPSTATPSESEVTQADIDQAELEVSSAQASVNSANASLSSALITYNQAQADESDLTVTAPCSGIVYSLDIESGDEVSGSGSSSGGAATTDASGSSSSGAPVTLAPEQPLAVQLTVNEVDLPTLEVGQRADIDFDALTDLTSTGKVYEIAEEGLNNQGVVTFDVWLSLDVVDDSLRAGMSAAASIVTDIAKDVLLVPNGAVNSDGSGGYYVEVLNDGANEPEQVAVETGLASATQTEIVSGLSEGDPVVTQTSESGDDEEASGGGLMLPGMGGGRPQ